ncbi:osmotically inducible protein C [Lewinellaceae bacterium SD302]|nr:osmotically inducible protein C [Lewinellaceae bacterium SD302]
MRSEKIKFPNAAGIQLSARLEMPVDRHPHAYAIFAHCFTCSSSLIAVRQISRALNLKGIAVLRFDFTGLGGSEGDFADSNFTTNISDLVAAADWLTENHLAPSLLVGHSLGGAAVLCAAHQLPSVVAVATIGAPFEVDHIKGLLKNGLEEIMAKGEATVNIGGRDFKIKQQFLDDLVANKVAEKIGQLGKALLILHSPQDTTVNIDEAAKIYHAARHPKSFVSLDGADHLLSDKTDSHYAGEVIAGWSGRYVKPVDSKEEQALRSSHSVAVRLGTEGFTTEVMVRRHSLTADEPESIGGNDFGPNPYELVSAGLGACTAMTIQMYARRKKWPVEVVRVHLDHRKDYEKDMMAVSSKGEPKQKVDHFDRVIEFEGDLSEEQVRRLLEIADRCPVHRTLHGEVVVNTELG